MILSITNIKKDKPSNIECLKRINTYKNPVWVLLKCKEGFAYWIKTNKITFSKDKNKCYINNLEGFCNYNNLTVLCTKKRITLYEPNTEVEQILIHDEFPKKILKEYLKELKDSNKEFQKRINENIKLIEELTALYIFDTMQLKVNHE